MVLENSKRILQLIGLYKPEIVFCRVKISNSFLQYCCAICLLWCVTTIAANAFAQKVFFSEINSPTYLATGFGSMFLIYTDLIRTKSSFERLINQLDQTVLKSVYCP